MLDRYAEGPSGTGDRLSDPEKEEPPGCFQPGGIMKNIIQILEEV